TPPAKLCPASHHTPHRRVMNTLKRPMFRVLAAVLLLPLLLLSAGSTAIRGFDAASARDQMQWEKQARAIPDAARIRATIEKLSSRPHLAGTAASKETAEWLLAQLQSWGLDAK